MDPLQPSKLERLKGIHAHRESQPIRRRIQMQENREEKLQPTNMKAYLVVKERILGGGKSAVDRS